MSGDYDLDVARRLAEQAARVNQRGDKRNEHRRQDDALNEFRKSPLVESVAGDEAATALREAGDGADPIWRILSMLVEVRDEMRTDLKTLVVQLEGTKQTFECRDRGDNSNEAPRQHPAPPVDSHDAVSRLRKTVDKLTHLDIEIANTCARSKTFRRMAGLFQDYAYDGVLFGAPSQRRGFPQRMLQEHVFTAFDWTLPVVSVVYNDSRVLKMNESDFLRELRRRLGRACGAGTAEKVLNGCAMTLETTRCFYAPNPEARVRLRTEELIADLVRHLRDPQLSPWLRPLGRDGGEGSGPTIASYHLIANATGIPWSNIRGYVREVEKEGRARRVVSARSKRVPRSSPTE